MRIFFIVLFVTFITLLPTGGRATGGDGEKQPRILILLDGSSSMLHEWTKDNIRFEAAAKIIERLMDSVYSVNKDVEFGLRVYGHQSPTSKNNCYDTKLEVMFSKDNYTQMMLRLADLHPLGISPIAYSIEQSAELDMKDLLNNKYSLILITDGGESCNGDICKTVEHMLSKKIDFKPYILSLLDYAPLRSQYACMGEYLQVTKPEEIDPVVGRIVEAYRHTFIQPVTVSKAIETARKTPSVLKVTMPEVKLTIPEEKPEPKKEVPVVAPQPVVKKEPPVAAPKPAEPEQPKPQPVPAPKPSKIVVDDVQQRKKAEPVWIYPARMRQLPERYTSKALYVVKMPVVKIVVPDAEPERPKEPSFKPMQTTTAAQAPVITTKPAPKVAEFKVTREEAKETSLEVFFTNGKGKYYETAPEVVLRDMRTNEPVVKFNRTVDAYGKPRPQLNIPPGTYNLTITGKEGFVVPNIEVRANNKNRPEIVVSDGSLAFMYAGNSVRPVKEFVAKVNPLFKRNAVTMQPCKDIVEYSPENYHVEVNTNPRSKFNVDLDFGLVVYLTLEEPGQVKVFNTRGFAQVEFYYQHGDQYELFRPTDVKGNAKEQEFLIQPGRYKVAYIKDALVPNPKPFTKDFVIKSNTITELTLD